VRRAVAVLAFLSLLLLGCAEDEGSGGASATTEAWVIDLGAGPAIEIPGGPPPRRLVVEDLRPGDGPAAKPGDELTVEYLGAYWSGDEFTNSWDRPQPFRFELGSGDIRITPAWNEGLLGIRVGGRRKLIAPPDWLYRGSPPPELGPDDTLVYVVDLISLR
jgi:peptidylprolyl isomerase